MRARGLQAIALRAFVLAALLAPAVAPAQSSSLTAVEFAQRIDKHYNSLHSLEVQFSQKYEGMGMNRKEAGVLLLKKPGKMRWTYSQPEGKLFVLDGKYGYFYSPGDTEVQRVPVKKLDDMRSPLRLLLGHAKLEQELTKSGDCSSGRWDVYADGDSEGVGEARGGLQRDGDGGWRDPVDEGGGDGRNYECVRVRR